MAKPKTAGAYERELQRMIEARTDTEMEVWLKPQVRATAANMVILDKIQAEILDTDRLVTNEQGSMGQKKREVSPLLPYYDKLQRTLLMQYEALGLNYKATPSKVLEAKPAADEDEAIRAFYANGKQTTT